MSGLLQTITDRGAEACELGEEPGGCMRAAVASIFELPMLSVPHFVDTGPKRDGNKNLWLHAWHGWALRHGVVLRHFEVVDAEHLALPGYSIVVGLSPRDHGNTPQLLHCCVAWNGQIVWDPHPSGDGLVDVREADYLVPITDDAARLLDKAPRECDVARDAASITDHEHDDRRTWDGSYDQQCEIATWSNGAISGWFDHDNYLRVPTSKGAVKVRAGDTIRRNADGTYSVRCAVAERDIG